MLTPKIAIPGNKMDNEVPWPWPALIEYFCFRYILCSLGSFS